MQINVCMYIYIYIYISFVRVSGSKILRQRRHLLGVHGHIHIAVVLGGTTCLTLLV